GHLHGHRRRAHRRPQRRHEHHRPGRLHPQPVRYRLGGHALLELAGPPAHHGRPVLSLGDPVDAGGPAPAPSGRAPNLLTTTSSDSILESDVATEGIMHESQAPLTAAMFNVLLSLADGEKHGY